MVIIFCLSPVLPKGQNSRPNIIYIMSDDHAYQAISAYGFGLNCTPNIDKLAKEGCYLQKLM